MAQPVIKEGALELSSVDAISLGGQTVGTGANNIVALDGLSRLPDVDGSQLLNINATTLLGQTIGTGPNNVVALDGSSRLPAVDGSQLTNVLSTAVPAVTLSGLTTTVASSIPSNVSLIDLSIDNLSQSVFNSFGVRVGTGGVPATTGYSVRYRRGTVSAMVASFATSSFLLGTNNPTGDADNHVVHMRLRRIGTTNTWTVTYDCVNLDEDWMLVGAGRIALAGNLDIIQVFGNTVGLTGTASVTYS